MKKIYATENREKAQTSLYHWVVCIIGRSKTVRMVPSVASVLNSLLRRASFLMLLIRIAPHHIRQLIAKLQDYDGTVEKRLVVPEEVVCPDANYLALPSFC